MNDIAWERSWRCVMLKSLMLCACHFAVRLLHENTCICKYLHRYEYIQMNVRDCYHAYRQTTRTILLRVFFFLVYFVITHSHQVVGKRKKYECKNEKKQTLSKSIAKIFQQILSITIFLCIIENKIWQIEYFYANLCDLYIFEQREQYAVVIVSVYWRVHGFFFFGPLYAI